MKIGMIGTIWEDIPPKKYGGTEQVIYNLTEQLVKMGHDVTLFAPATTKTSATLVPTVSEPLAKKHISWFDISYHLYHLTQVFDRAQEFDILHLHLNKNQDYMALPLASLSKTPVITTLHFSPPTPAYRPERYQLLAKYKDLPFTSISYAQRDASDLNFIANVYNCIDIKDYPFCPTPKEYFLWLGKIMPTKGTKEAILAAKKANVQLLIAGVVDSGVPEFVQYFEREVKSLIDGKQIIFLGEVGLPQKAKLLGEAKALLNPIQWEEPFGLVMLEAQACGTPVIATNRGAAPEVIQDGKTGFLVKDISEMVEKIRSVEELDRMACRKFVADMFTLEHLAEGYLRAYKATIEHWPTYLLGENERKESLRDKIAEV